MVQNMRQEEGQLFGVRAIESGFYGGVAQSRPTSPTGGARVEPADSSVSLGTSTLVGRQSPKSGKTSPKGSIASLPSKGKSPLAQDPLSVDNVNDASSFRSLRNSPKPSAKDFWKPYAKPKTYFGTPSRDPQASSRTGSLAGGHVRSGSSLGPNLPRRPSAARTRFPVRQSSNADSDSTRSSNYPRWGQSFSGAVAHESDGVVRSPTQSSNLDSRRGSPGCSRSSTSSGLS